MPHFTGLPPSLPPSDLRSAFDTRRAKRKTRRRRQTVGERRKGRIIHFPDCGCFSSSSLRPPPVFVLAYNSGR